MSRESGKTQAGEPLKKPWWVLSTGRGWSWYLAIFYTALAAWEPYFVFASGDWWWWLIGVFLTVTAVVAWVSLAWVLRHPRTAPNTTGPPGVEDRDDVGP